MNINELLRQEVPVNVVFTKSDGSRREMWCSLNAKWLPPVDPEKEPKPAKARPEGLVTVYEINTGWRSFKIDTLLEVRTYPNIEDAVRAGLKLND